MKIDRPSFVVGRTVAQLFEAPRYKPDGLWVWFPKVSLELIVDVILPAALWPWIDSASNRNEYQEYFLGGGLKAAGA